MSSANQKGFVSSPAEPRGSKHMLWVRDVALPFASDECLIFPFARNQNGYASTIRSGKKLYFHRYICQLVHGEPPTPMHEAAHSCNNGHLGCVSHRHLSWKTPAENQLDNFRERPKPGRFKLQTHQAEEIRALRGKEHITITAARYGISVSHAQNIQSGYAPIPGKASMKFLTDAQVNEIRALAGTRPDAEVGRLLGVSLTIVNRIRNGVSYKHVPPTLHIQERSNG